MQLGLGLGLGVAAAYAAASPWLPHAFSDDAQVAAAVWALLPLVIGMLPLNALVRRTAASVQTGALLAGKKLAFHVSGQCKNRLCIERCSSRCYALTAQMWRIGDLLETHRVCRCTSWTACSLARPTSDFLQVRLVLVSSLVGSSMS